MTPEGASAAAERVLVLAPGRDGELIETVLRQAGIAACRCADLPALCRELDAGAAAALLVEEQIHEGVWPLAERIAAAPPWSDLPVLVLTWQGVDSPAIAELLAALGNVTLLERPTRVPSLISTVQSALRARRRQYEVRDHLAARQAADARRAIELAVSHALTGAVDAAETLHAVLGLLAESLGWSLAQVWQIDAAAGPGRCLVEWRPASEQAAASDRAATLGADLAQRVWLSGGPVRIADLRCAAPFVAATDSGGARSAAGWPIRCGAGIAAALVACGDGTPATDGDTAGLLTTVLARIGQFLERRLVEEQRTQAESLLRERTAILRAISASTSDLIFVKDRDGRLVLGNPALFAVIGPEAEVMGRTDLEFHPDPAHARHVMETDRQVMHSGVAEVVEEAFGPPGNVRTFLATKSPYRDDSGAVIGLLGIARDITDRKRAEDALREVDRRKDEFLATLAHELRNPLAPIRSAAELLRVTESSDDAERARVIIDRQAGLLSRLVDDLLDVSRITSGKIELRRQPVEVAGIVAAAVETSRPLLEAGGHHFTVSLPSEPVWLFADAVRVGQSISNLLNNAAKFTPAGGHINLAVTASQDEVVVRVCDDGVGIAPQALPRIFELFTQIDPALERARGGLGIGLNLVRVFVEMHGGRVAANSDGLGRGSEFVLRLPRVQAPEVAAAPLVATPGASPASGTRILVVDDNEDGAESLSLLLAMAGNEVRVAHDGVQAVDMAARFAPRIVLLDIGLPKLNGYEVARRIRALPNGAGVLLIALTGWGTDPDRVRSKAAGFDHHLVKPVNMDALRVLLGDAGAAMH